MKHIMRFSERNESLKIKNESIEEGNSITEINYDDFETEKKNRTIIPVDGIIEISRCKGKKWLRGWSQGKLKFELSGSESIEKIEGDSKLIQAKFSINNVVIVDIDIYYLENTNYLIKCNSLLLEDKFYILNDIKELNNIIENYIQIVSKYYPKVK